MTLRIAAFLTIAIPALGCLAGDPGEHPAVHSVTAVLHEPAAVYADTTGNDTRGRFRAAMIFAEAEGLAGLPLGEIMIRLGERYLGVPYVAGPLDGFGKEVVVARLDAFDCFTYIEAILAMARGVAAGDTTFAGYVQRTEEQRYRQGTAGTYCSRLHYFTEWVDANARRGLVSDVTEEAGGIPFSKDYGFMTANRGAYPALKDDSEFQCIENVEADLNARIRLFFIPQDEIASAYGRLQPGDLVATVTNIEGLDVTHTGLVYINDDGSVGLLHASTSGGVKVSPSLGDYVMGVRAQVGILVARANQ
ncbi:MAG: cell wall-associated NlpC family hydrolase [Rhodothermales bacterium]|jgi:cell wall-associated NlpC family hydrolase